MLTLSQLTAIEITALTEAETTIERGLNTFVEVGNALAEIRDGKLYRQTYNTFEDYCQQRWNIERRRAYQLMEAASVVVNVQNFSQVVPSNDAQARPLARLQPTEQIAAWREAVETAPNGKVTAAHVERVVQEFRQPPPVLAPDSMAIHYSSKTGEWETPQELFDLLDKEFGFTLDVCALPTNAKCDRYFTPADNGLIQDWTNSVCWMNPPYGDEIKAWVIKAAETAAAGGTVVCLLPARVDTAWWWDYCRFGEVRFLRGRLKFGGGDSGAPFPSAIVIFQPQGEPCVVWWELWR